MQDVKVGDTVGVGAQIGSCGECKFCKTGNESESRPRPQVPVHWVFRCAMLGHFLDTHVFSPSDYCNVRMIDTYGSTFDDGTFQHGGYANYIRAHTQFTFKIPVSPRPWYVPTTKDSG